MKNVILGYATNCRFEDFFRFVASARESCPADVVDVVVFIDALGADFGRAANDYGIHLVPVENVWRWARGSRLLNLFYHATLMAMGLLARWAPAAHRAAFADARRRVVADWIHPQAGRWLAYLSYLRVNCSYQKVMTSDVRDVVFQACPFDNLDGGVLHVFRQSAVVYGDDNVDTGWYRKVYGAKGVKAVRGLPTLCSGTVLGGYPVFINFLEKMAAEIVRQRRVPLDQAVFNHVVNHHLDPAQVLQHALGSGPVLTLAGDHAWAWAIRADRVEVGDRPVPVVHMYDRHPRTKDLILANIPVPSPCGKASADLVGSPTGPR
jgi:hypothetical protein